MLTQASTATKITFEQPLNEQIRICLRLEHLQNEFEQCLSLSSETGSRIAITALLKSVNVIDRPDIKTKLLQSLSEQASSLAQLEQFPQVNKQRLHDVLKKLDEMINYLHHFHGKMADKLRQNDFLNQIRMQLNNPAGACPYRLPAFACWLAKPMAARRNDLQEWNKEFSQIHNITKMILNITRNTTSSQRTVAKNGFFQQALDPALPSQLIQVTLPIDANLYPEISVGLHRLNIRFLQPHYLNEGRASQSQEDIQFEFNCCR